MKCRRPSGNDLPVRQDTAVIFDKLNESSHFDRRDVLFLYINVVEGGYPLPVDSRRVLFFVCGIPR
jgi:hypothetical protein